MSTEPQLAKLQTVAAPKELAKAEGLLPRVGDGYREVIADLPNARKRDVARARAGIRRMLDGGRQNGRGFPARSWG